MHNPRVSVVIPARNAALYLRDSIDSILNQTFSDFEILIIDDNSTDNTLEIIRTYRDDQLIVLKNPSKGLPAALNFGMKKAKGEFIARMDADDIANNTRLQKQVDYLDANPNLGVCGTLFKEFGDGDVIHDHKECVRYADILRGCYIGHPTAMFRLALFRRNNLYYDKSLPLGEDYDLWSRAVRVMEIGNVQEVLLRYRRHGSSVTASNLP